MFGKIVYTLLLGRLVTCNLIFKPQDILLEIDDIVQFEVLLTSEGNNEVLQLYTSQKGIVEILNENITLSKDEKKIIHIKGENSGHVIILGNLTNRPDVNTDEAVVRASVGKSSVWIILSDITGWLYFAAWSFSFYPQIYENWRRKSVVGLNFDFLALNCLGFFLYSAFNIGLYAVKPIKQNFHDRYPYSVNPVQINDIVFSLHALLAVIATLVQCFIYERENQKVSIAAKILFGLFLGFLGISFVLACTSVIQPIDFLYHCSYVKLSITFIKYIPQAYMNFRRKSTVGWSIGNIFLDLIGGILSVMQMIINSYNFDDWQSIFGDFTKFGLGLFSVLFDLFFMFQHYVLYKRVQVLD